MANELVIQDDFSKQLAELDKIQETCKKLMNTKHYAKMGEDGIHTIIARCKSLGIHPFEGLNGGFYMVSGKMGMSTEMMAALVRKRGHSITKDPKSNDDIVILHGKRADSGDTWTCSFSKQDAQKAGLWDGPTWKKYPAVMLYNRCMSMLFRQLFPDLSMGAGYVEDELKEIAKVDEYKLPVTECVITTPIKQDFIKVDEITEEQTESLHEMIDKLRSVLKDCGQEYEVRILTHYGVEHISKIPEEEMKKVIVRAHSFREDRKRQQELQG
jgi:hypothetical protein